MPAKKIEELIQRIDSHDEYDRYLEASGLPCKDYMQVASLTMLLERWQQINHSELQTFLRTQSTQDNVF